MDGREEGRKEERKKAEQEKHQIAKNLLLKGIDVDTVASVTGFSSEVIFRIKMELE